MTASASATSPSSAPLGDSLIRSIDLPKYCATRGVAISRDRIRALLNSGAFPAPALVLGPRARYWRAGDVDAFLRGESSPTTSRREED